MKLAFRLLLSLLLAVSPAWAAVAKNDSGTPNKESAGVSSLDLTTFTVSTGTNLCLVGFLHTSAAVTSTSATWDNAGTPQAMTSAGTVTNTRRTEIFYLIAPHTGNLTLHFAWTTSVTAVVGAAAFSGADQSTCINSAHTVTNTGTSIAPSTGAITSTTDGATVGAATVNGTSGMTTTTQTAIYLDNTGSTVRSGATYGLGGTSNTHTWGAGGIGLSWSAVGIHILASHCGALALLGVGC